MATDRIYRLTEVLRHDGAVLNLATATRQMERGRAPFLPATGGGSRVVTYPSLSDWLEAAIAAASSPEAQADPDHTRLLAYTNRNVASLNQLVRRRLYGSDAPPFVPGERIISHDAIADPSGGSPLVNSTTEMVITAVETTSTAVIGDELREVAIASHGSRRFKAGEVIAAPWTFHRIAAEAAVTGPVCFDVLDQAELTRWKKVSSALAKTAQNTPHGCGRSALWDVWFKRGDRFGQVQPASALTIHKSQGSTFRRVFLHPDVDGFSRGPSATQNRLAYVGISRASHELHVVADREGQ